MSRYGHLSRLRLHARRKLFRFVHDAATPSIFVVIARPLESWSTDCLNQTKKIFFVCLYNRQKGRTSWGCTLFQMQFVPGNSLRWRTLQRLRPQEEERLQTVSRWKLPSLCILPYVSSKKYFHQKSVFTKVFLSKKCFFYRDELNWQKKTYLAIIHFCYLHNALSFPTI